MLIVQISDVHCGPMFNRQTFRTAIKEINAMSPDAVVVTGDLTEDGIQSQFKQAAKELARASERKPRLPSNRLLTLQTILPLQPNHTNRQHSNNSVKQCKTRQRRR